MTLPQWTAKIAPGSCYSDQADMLHVENVKLIFNFEKGRLTAVR